MKTGSNGSFKLNHITHSDDLLNYLASLTKRWNNRYGEGLWCFYGSAGVFLYMKYVQGDIGNIFDVRKKCNDDEKVKFFTDEYGTFRKPRDIDIIVKEEGIHETDIYDNEGNNKVDILHYRYKSIRALDRICFLSFNNYVEKVPVYPLPLLLEDVIEFEAQKEARKWDRQTLESIREKEQKGYISLRVENAHIGPLSAKKERGYRSFSANDNIQRKLLFNNE